MDFTSLERFGSLHLLLLHLPIGCVAVAVWLELLQMLRPTEEGRRTTRHVLGFNAVLTLVTAGFGLLLAERNSYPEELLFWHRWAGVACAGFAILAWLFSCGKSRWLVRGALFLLAGSTVAAGHLGATLTHGEEVVEFWKSPPPGSEPVRESKEDSLFTHKIEPILASHCYECHGNGNSKGRLRLDKADSAAKGGKSGKPAIVPKDVAKSEMIRRIKLPPDDPSAMPGSDLPPLKPEQIATLEKWIAEGAMR